MPWALALCAESIPPAPGMAPFLTTFKSLLEFHLTGEAGLDFLPPFDAAETTASYILTELGTLRLCPSTLGFKFHEGEELCDVPLSLHLLEQRLSQRRYSIFGECVKTG